jgi:hypothetical protein
MGKYTGCEYHDAFLLAFKFAYNGTLKGAYSRAVPNKTQRCSIYCGGSGSNAVCSSTQGVVCLQVDISIIYVKHYSNISQ